MTSTAATERYQQLTHDDAERAQLATPAPRPPAEQLLDPATGSIAIGHFADGTTARMPLWNTDGAAHNTIAAETGAGATTLLGHLLAAEHASDLVRSWVAVDHGVPLGLAERTAARYDSTGLLREAIDLIDERLRDSSTGPFRPTPDRPLISVTADWMHLPQHARHLAHEIATTGRTAGVALRVFGRGPLPGSLPLAGLIPRGAVLGFRAMPGRGLLIDNRTAAQPTFRTWAPAQP